MSSINRPLAGPVLTFDLAAQIAEVRAEDAFRRSGKAGRTLAKHGRFRLTLTVLRAGGEVGTHQADSPMTVHVLEGALRFRVGGTEHTLRAGEVLFFGPGDAEDIRALEDSAFLLTISASGDDFRDG